MAKKQDYYNRANDNKKQALESLEKPVDQDLPWQHHGIVEEIAEEEPVVEITEDKPLPDSIQSEEVKSQSSVVNITELQSQLSTLGVVILQNILKYMEDMKPGKPVTPKEGGLYQAAFFNNIKTMFNKLEVSEFNLLYKQVLLLIHENREGVFSDSKVFRFYEEWVLNDEDRRGFMSLVTLMLVTCDPRTRRQSLRTIKNWNHVLAKSLTDEARMKIKNFYNINI